MSTQVPNGQPATNSGQSTALNLSNPQGGYDLKKLREIHHLILRLAALGTLTNKEIADAVGRTEAMVGYTINSELGQQKLAVLRGEADFSIIDVIAQFEESAPLAAEYLEQVVLSPTEKTSDRIRAAENILGGAGYGKRERVDIYQHGVTDDEIEEARKRAREKGRSAGIVVDYEDAKVIEETDSE